MTLDQIAADAGVTVQTVIRRFGSKEGIVRTLSEVITRRVVAQRDEASTGDLREAVAEPGRALRERG